MFAAGKTNAVASAATPTYVDDVFSTYLYTGNGSTQTINNGIDLAGKGGLTWFKDRTTVQSHVLIDSVRGTNKALFSNETRAQATESWSVTYNSNGMTLPGSAADPSNGVVNFNGHVMSSWTFRKQAKFFDIVTYTGDGVSGRTVAHSLGQVPGCIMVKRTDTTAAWAVYHRSLSNTEYLVLNDTAAKATGATYWNSTTPTATEFSLGTDTTVNANTGTYVAYLFAHDAGGFGLGGTDNVISCGSYTGNGSTSGPVTTLGYEPQWILIKNASATTGVWVIVDNMRGLPVGTNSNVLFANTSGAEGASVGGLTITATGFRQHDTDPNFNASGNTYIYIAIRRPNKPPTSGTQVFQPTVYTGTNVNNRLVNTTIAPDMVWVRQRNDTVLAGLVVGDRLRGQPYLLTGSTAAEVTSATALDQQIVSTTEYGNAFSSMNGFWVGTDATAKLNVNTTASNHIAEAFKRAPGVFDVVAYTGTGANTTQAHNLGVVPELILVKRRGTTGAWPVYSAAISNTEYLVLNTTAAKATGTTYWNSTTPTSSVFSLGTAADVNASTASNTYVAYLFASAAGISKVGTYTGNGGTAGTNGTSQTINCGFAAGARFVLIKRTDNTGDWYVFDSARGIVASSDPYLLTNSTAAEVTSVDAVDADNSGFIVNQTSGTDLNVTSATYIYLAYA